MIGVKSRKNQRESVEEFFELFKTPWEPYSEGSTYDVVITSDPTFSIPAGKLVIVFGPEETAISRQFGVKFHSLQNRGVIEWEGVLIPVYGQVATFAEPCNPFLYGKAKEVMGIALDLSDGKVLRVGYDLFDEVDYLLGKGQPVENAGVPTLEIHIAMLRKWILGQGIPLVEIPPSPHGYDFITCLTHDIDFMGIRDHGFDHTLFGYVYRSLIPKYLKGMDRRTFFTRYLKNLRALLSLPLVHMGLCPDFWYPLDRYLEVERDLKSSFFFLPYKNLPGESLGGKPGSYRAARYDVTRYKEPILSLARKGCEVGLHGIASWRDPSKGREEVEVIRKITGKDRIGVRIHWLYFSDETPKHLEEAGVYYDSTLGYNDTVGYRSGTTQVFRLPGTSKVFELPLNVQDTAMFYTGRMNLSESQAISLCGKLLQDVRGHGGVFTINWHDRSLSPERNWDSAYLKLLEMLRIQKTWFATAGEAVAWFEKRRSIRFTPPETTCGVPKVRMEKGGPGTGPPVTLRVYHPKDSWEDEGMNPVCFTDYLLDNEEKQAVGS